MADRESPSRFYVMPVFVMERADLSLTEKVTLCILGSISDGVGECKASNKRLGKYLGLSEFTARKVLYDLRQRGAISIDVQRDSKRRVISRTITVLDKFGGKAPEIKEKPKPMKPKEIEGKVSFIPVNPDTGEDEEPFYFSSKEVKAIERVLPQNQEAARKEFAYWLWQLHCYREDNPSGFKKKKDLARTILNWRRMRRAEGKLFCAVGPAGASYYPAWKVKEMMEELS